MHIHLPVHIHIHIHIDIHIHIQIHMHVHIMYTYTYYMYVSIAALYESGSVLTFRTGITLRVCRTAKFRGIICTTSEMHVQLYLRAYMHAPGPTRLAVNLTFSFFWVAVG